MFGATQNHFIMPQNQIAGSYNANLQNANNGVTVIINIFGKKKLKKLRSHLKLKHLTMKKLPLFLILISVMSSCMTPQAVTFSRDEFVRVYDVPGSQNELYLKANAWMVGKFVNAESVIQHNDKEEGAIIGKYLMFGTVATGLYGITTDSRVFSIIDIRVKDNRVRLNIVPENYNATWYTKDKALADMERMAVELEASLRAAAITF